MGREFEKKVTTAVGDAVDELPRTADGLLRRGD
jgi:hypothetical protein